jgi:hypothetical protein
MPISTSFVGANDTQSSAATNNLEKPGAISTLIPNAAIYKRINSIIIPKIEFENAPYKEVVDFLINESKKADPEKRGVSITLKDFSNEVLLGKLVTLKMENAPLLTSIKYLTTITGTRYRIEPTAVVLSINNEPTWNAIQTRSFEISVDAVQKAMKTPSPDKTQVRAFFKEYGIDFPVGTGSGYDGGRGKLFVIHDRDILDQIDRLLVSLKMTSPAKQDGQSKNNQLEQNPKSNPGE